MYIKVVVPHVVGTTIGSTTIIEVKQFKQHVEAGPDGDPCLVLDLDRDRLLFSETDPVVVYVMNDDGKTIDKIFWDEETNHSEMLG